MRPTWVSTGNADADDAQILLVKTGHRLIVVGCSGLLLQTGRRLIVVCCSVLQWVVVDCFLRLGVDSSQSDAECCFLKQGTVLSLRVAVCCFKTGRSLADSSQCVAVYCSVLKTGHRLSVGCSDCRVCAL